MGITLYYDNVWWNADTDDKPSIEYFENVFLQSPSKKEIDGGVNFVDDENIHIVVANVDLNNNPTYLSITNPNYTNYYYFDKVINVGSKTTCLQFKLDLFTTYLLKSIKKNLNKTIKTVRNHKLTKNAFQYVDDMMQVMFKEYEKVNVSYDVATTFNKRFDGTDWLWFSNTTNNVVTLGSDSWITNGCFYYVYAASEDDVVDITKKNSYIYIPVLTTYLDRRYNKISIKKIDSGNPWAFDNDYEQLTYAMNNSKLANKFVGCYYLPSFYNFVNYWDRVILSTTNSSMNFACMVFNFLYGIKLEKVVGVENLKNELKYLEPNVRPNFNQGDKLHPIALNYCNVKYYNQTFPINQYLFRDNNTCFFGFSSTGYFAFQSQFDPFVNNIFALPDTLPVMQDSYQKYLVATKATRDTALQTSKENFILNGVHSVVSGASSLLSGNPLAIASAGVSSVFSLTSSYLGYSQKKRQIASQMQDTLRTSSNQVHFSANEQFINYRQGEKEYETSGNTAKVFDLWCTYNTLSESTIKELNNVVYLYGNINPDIDTINNYLSINSDFNYMLVDKGYMDTIAYSFFSGLFIPKRFYNRLILELTEGIRFWNQPPNYLN